MVSRHVLPSGLTILIETLPYVRSVALGYYLRSGSAVETEEHAGASHFLEHLVFKGTATRNTSDIARVSPVTSYQYQDQRAREAALRHDLFEMRKAIDDFYADKQKYPD